MGTEQTVIAVSNAVAAVLPSIVGLFQSMFGQAHPNDPQPTSAEVLQAFASQCLKTLAVDDDWLKTHPLV